MRKIYEQPSIYVNTFKSFDNLCVNIPVSGGVDDPSQGEAKERSQEIEVFENVISTDGQGGKVSLW